MIVLGLGGNIGSEAAILDRFRSVRSALMELGTVRSASLYRTAPIGPEQAPFLNSALAVHALDLEPIELLATTRELERLLGRDRTREVHWGPRRIDLDVLLWGARVLHLPPPEALEVPHPRLAQRRFALAPLADLVGDAFVLPGGGTVGAALAAVRDQAIEQVAERW